MRCTLSVNTEFRCCDTVETCIHTVAFILSLKQRCACVLHSIQLILSQFEHVEHFENFEHFKHFEHFEHVEHFEHFEHSEHFSTLLSTLNTF